MSKCILKCCDARDGLAQIKDESIDLIFTDPPYRVISGGNKYPTAPKGMLSANDGKHFEHNDIHFTEYVPHLYRVLKPGKHCYIMTNVLNMFELQSVAIMAGFRLHNVLIWKKNTATPNRWYMKNCEYILMFRKGNAVPIRDCGAKTVIDFPIVKDRDHPTEKPQDLVRYYVENSSDPQDIVLDPFMGVGTTGQVCAITGRKFVGFELDPTYYTKSCIRLGEMPR
jgi:site-specific DNA-methyltransferase (adenine-specific)